MGKKVLAVLLSVLFLSICLLGCAPKKDPSKRIVKIEVTGDKEQGTKMFGAIKPDVPSSAGFSSKSIEIVIPGSVEVECGPANYEVSFMAWSQRKMKCQIYVDGVAWNPPKVLVNAGEGSYSAMFEIKAKGEDEKKK